MTLRPFIPMVVLALAACTANLPEEGAGAVPAVNDATTGGPLMYPQVDDNVRHDTLLVHTTFDLGDGTFVMVAEHIEGRRAGLRLYRYRTRADSSAEVIAVSSPGYDSETLFPMFFRHPADSNAWLVLANLGERESWGQKVFTLDQRGFTDQGFLDVAMPVVVDHGGGAEKRLMSIAGHARCSAVKDGVRITFACDKVHLYDDQRGKLDLEYAGHSVWYIIPAEGKAVLWVEGREHSIPELVPAS
jgi:hypothetical protein